MLDRKQARINGRCVIRDLVRQILQCLHLTCDKILNLSDYVDGHGYSTLKKSAAQATASSYDLNPIREQTNCPVFLSSNTTAHVPLLIIFG